MNDMIIILASASPRRKELLELMGFEPVIIPSNADEASDIKDPEALVLELSKRKCRDVAGSLPEEYSDKTVIVVGADTVVAADKMILGKPHGEEEARAMLENISGRTHQVLTGVSVACVRSGKTTAFESFSEKTDVKVAQLSKEAIDGYIATGEPFDKAGAYGIQGCFGKYVEGIDGDYYNVVGLPICSLNKHLEGMKNEMQ